MARFFIVRTAGGYHPNLNVTSKKNVCTATTKVDAKSHQSAINHWTSSGATAANAWDISAVATVLSTVGTRAMRSDAVGTVV